MKNFFKKFKKTFILISFFIVVLICYFAFNILNGKAEDSGDRIHFISIQNGDAIIIESNGHFGLVDAANPSEFNGSHHNENGTDVLNYAKKLGIDYFDFVIMTHNHSDHIGGIPELAELFNDKTIVFYKEDLVSYNSNHQIDDYEELIDNGSWKNHELYEAALTTFESKNSILCDVSKIGKTNGCDLSTLSNDFISSIAFDSNEEFNYDTNVKENIYFDFGDFKINLYNLHVLSYHRENSNSIVTLLTHKTGEASAVLTGDIESSIGDLSYQEELSGKSNLILEPTGDCEECTTLGIDGQIADVIGSVSLVKASHHGASPANSKYTLSSYKPEYFITQGVFDKDSNGVYPHHKSSAAAIIFLKNAYGTKSYFSGQADGAVVAQFSDNDDEIIIENYDSNATSINTSLEGVGQIFNSSGWQDMKKTNFSDKAWAYIENEHEVVSTWKYINNEYYHFNRSGILDTGFFADEDGDMYYSCTINDDCTEGSMRTGWITIDGDRYYFRDTANYPTLGKLGSMVDGWQEIEQNWYYFEDGVMQTGLTQISNDNEDKYYYFSEEETTLGRMQVGWIKINDEWYYFNESGEAYTGWQIVDNKQYYFDETGKSLTGLQYLSRDGFSNYYYFEEHDSSLVGVMQTGWIKIGDNWYLFNSLGKAITGWYTDNQNTYYFESDGKLATGLKYLSYNDEYNYYYFAKDEETTNNNAVTYHIHNQSDLENYLASTGNNITGDNVYFENTDDITFPEGKVYYLKAYSDTSLTSPDVYWYITKNSKGNINFNSSTFLIGDLTTLYVNATGNHLSNNSKQVISSATFYGSVNNTINSNGSVTSNKGNFNADLLKASNIEFKNLVFNNVQDINDHIFDVIASDHITFDNVTTRGYFGNYTQQELSTAYNKSGHSLYAEAIQIDVANPGATGINDLSETEIFDNSMSDGSASTYITIKNSYFGPYNGETGESIINRSNNVVIKPYGSTIGSHSYDSVNGTSGYTNIVVTNNNFVNTIYMNPSNTTDSDVLKRKEMYPVHMRTHVKSGYPIITVSDNTFTNQFNGYTQYGEEVWGEVGYYGQSSATDGNAITTDLNANSTVDNASGIKNNVAKPGIMQTGWLEIDGKWYYFDENGKAVTGFNTINSKTYYFRTSENDISEGPKASMVTGLSSINNYKYYFNTSTDVGTEGAMLKDAWKSVNSVWYHFGSDGKYSLGWFTDTDDSIYYLCEDSISCEKGSMYKGWNIIGDDTYYFRTSDDNIKPGKEGAMLTGLSVINSKTYYFREDNSSGNIGSLFKNGTVEINNVFYTFDQNGELTSTNQVTSINTPTSADCNNVTYNGLEQDVASNKEGYSVVNNKGTDVGSYTVTAKLNQYYVWSDNTTSDKTFSCSIQKATPIITLTNETNNVLVGESQKVLTLSPNVDGAFVFSTSNENVNIKTLPKNVDADETLDLVIEGLEQGSAEINIGFIPTSSNYKEYTYTKNIVVNNKTAIIPTAADYCKNDIVYNGSEQTITNNPGDGFTLGNNVQTNAGNYNVIANLKAGYTWSDGSVSTKIFECSVDKAPAGEFTVTSYNGTYDVSSHTVQVSEVEWGTIYYSTDGDTWTTSSVIRTYPGNTHVYVYVKGDSNHLDSEVKHAYINIEKAIPEVSINIVNEGKIKTDVYTEYATLTSNLSGKYLISIDGDFVSTYPTEIVTDAGETKTLSLKGTQVGNTTLHLTFIPNNENYDSVVFSHNLNVSQSDTIVDLPTSNSVCKTDLIYNEEEQILTYSDTAAYSFTNNRGTNAGDYNVTVSLKPGYQWADESYSSKTVVCSISKLKLDEPIINDYIGEYDGSSHTITISNASGKTVKYSTNGEDFTTLIPGRVNVGKTNVYAKFIGDSNHYDSDASSGSITINKTSVNMVKSNEVNDVEVGFDDKILTFSANVDGTYTFSTGNSNIAIKTLPRNTDANESIDLNIEALSSGNADINVTFIPSDSNNYNVYTESLSVHVSNVTVDIPTADNYCKTGLIYSGDNQTITKTPSAGYTFSNNEQRNAGTYTIAAKLNNGYEWSDGTLTDKTFDCSISKLTPIITVNDMADSLSITNKKIMSLSSNVLGQFSVTSDEYLSISNYSLIGGDISATGIKKGIGHVYINFTPNDGENINTYEETREINVIRHIESIPTADEYCNKNLEYNESSQTLADSHISSISLLNNSGTNAGDYTVTAHLNNDMYEWQDGTIEDKSFVCSIAKASPNVTIGEVNTSNIVQYTNNEILSLVSNVSGKFKFTTDGNKISNYQNEITVTANQNIKFAATGEEIGESNLVVSFIPDNNNYNTYSKSFNINVVENVNHIAEIPTSDSVCINGLVYDESEKMLTVSNTEAYEFINNTGINAGNYNITVRLKNDYKWSDNSTTDKTVVCSIAKASIDVPTISGYSGTYDGNAHFINVPDIPGASIRYSLDNSEWVIIPPSRTDAGTTKVYVKYVGDSNHLDSSVYSTNIIIDRANSVISSTNLVDTIENGQTITIGPIASNVDGVFTISSSDTNILTVPVLVNAVSANEQITTTITGNGVGNASYTISFTPNSNNYNTSSITKNINVTEVPKTSVLIPTSALYCKTNLKYTGSPLTITNLPGEGYTFSNNVQTNVGTYEVTAKLQEGYIWSDNTLNDKTFNCTILKADSYINFDNSLIVNNGYIKTKSVPITYSALKTKIDTNGTINYDKNDSELVSTCDTLSVTLDDVINNYKLIVIGDVTKNGTAGAADVNTLFNYLRGKAELNTCQLMAADVTNDDLLFINDVAKLYQFVNNKIGGLSD